MRNTSFLCNSFQSMTEVSGFENLAGITSANQMVASCSALETIFATSSTSGASVCKLGAGGVLTDPNADGRHWFWAHYYDDSGAVITASPTPDPTRELVASGRICAEARYVGLGFTPWDGTTGPPHRQYFTSVAFAADMAGLS